MSTPNVSFGLLSAIEVSYSTNSVQAARKTKTKDNCDLSSGKFINNISTKEHPMSSDKHGHKKLEKGVSESTMREIPTTVANWTTPTTTTPEVFHKYDSNKTNFAGNIQISRHLSKIESFENEFTETGNATLSNAGCAAASRTHQPPPYESVLLAKPTTLLPHEYSKQIKSINISFENICYGVKTGLFKRG